MRLKELNINEDNFDLFVALNPSDQIEFLFDAIQIGTEAATLKQVDKLSCLHDIPIEVKDFNVGEYRLVITSIGNEVHFNSNSIRAIRKFVSKLWNDGLILSKLDIKKTEFDVYRYFKAYKIIGRGYPFSPN